MGVMTLMAIPSERRDGAKQPAARTRVVNMLSTARAAATQGRPDGWRREVQRQQRRGHRGSARSEPADRREHRGHARRRGQPEYRLRRDPHRGAARSASTRAASPAACPPSVELTLTHGVVRTSVTSICSGGSPSERAKAGFTLVEVLIAVIVSELGVTALVGSSAMVTRMVGRGKMTTLAAQAANSGSRHCGYSPIPRTTHCTRGVRQRRAGDHQRHRRARIVERRGQGPSEIRRRSPSGGPGPHTATSSPPNRVLTTMRNHRGFTLVELPHQPGRIGVVTASLFKLVTTSQRVSRAPDRAGRRSSPTSARGPSCSRVGAPPDQRDQRGADRPRTTSSRSPSANATTLQFRAMRGLGFVCTAPAAGTELRIYGPPAAAGRPSTTAGSGPPRPP